MTSRRRPPHLSSAEEVEHGGIKIGSAFFGFLTAVGVGVLLTALLSAAGTAVGLATGTTDITSPRASRPPPSVSSAASSCS